MLVNDGFKMKVQGVMTLEDSGHVGLVPVDGAFVARIQPAKLEQGTHKADVAPRAQ